MTSRATYSGLDYGEEPTRTGVIFPTVSSANFDAVSASVDTVQGLINGVTLHDLTGVSFNAVQTPAGAKSSDREAQREKKWRVSYTDDVDPIGNGSFEIGMADLSLLASDSENMDTSSGAGLALVGGLEANIVSRLGNTITIASIKFVGRNT